MTGGIGLAAGHIEDVFRTDSVYYSIGPAINWRIFDAGRICANIDVQNAREQQRLPPINSPCFVRWKMWRMALVAYGQERQ